MDIKTYLSQNPKTHLIFDLDGTLSKLKIDWSHFRRGFWDIAESIDKPLCSTVPFESQMAIVLGEKIIRKHGPKVKDILNKYVETYEHGNYAGYILNPQLLSFVRENSHKYEMSVWTSNMRSVIADFLTKENLASCFKHIITRDDVLYLKPDPEGFFLIKESGVPENRYLMVGDNPFTDGQAAKRAGIDFLLEDYFD